MSDVTHFLSMTQGSDFVFDLSLDTDTDLTLDLGPFDVGMEIRRTRSSDSQIVQTLYEPGGRVTVNRDARTIHFAMSGAVTAATEAGSFYYAIVVSRDHVIDGVTHTTKFRIVEGRMVVNEPAV